MSTSQPNESLIPKFLMEAIKFELLKEFDAELERFTKNIQERKEELIALWAIKISKNMVVHTMENRITIEINKPT